MAPAEKAVKSVESEANKAMEMSLSELKKELPTFEKRVSNSEPEVVY